MPLDALPNPSFSKQVPGLQLAFDSVSLGALKKCPRFYELSIVQGYAPRGEQTDLFFGILYHSSLERYYHARAQGATHQDGVRKAVRYALEETWDKALAKPWASDHPQKNRHTLLRSIVWYLDQYGENDPFKTVMLANGKPAVELSFRLELDYQSHLSSETFMLCGHFDRLVEFQDAPYVADSKSTKHTLDDNYYSQFTPDNQMSGYAFAGKVVYSTPIRGVIIDACQVAVTFSRFDRRIIERTPAQLEEWHRDLGFWLTTAQQHARANYWPMNDRACFGCAFRGICSKSPSSREEWLRTGFVRRVWNPLQARGDI